MSRKGETKLSHSFFSSFKINHENKNEHNKKERFKAPL